MELISGAPIGKTSLSYFLEWRILSLQTRSDGTLKDRSGRFEDLFIAYNSGPVTIIAGQYRLLRQIDDSQKLGLSTPKVIGASIAGTPASNARKTSLRGFSPTGRSPSISVTLQTMQTGHAAEGWYNTITLPFPGEFSLPLTDEARDEASFELQGPPKGVFLETFYRRGLSSVGVHAFIDDDRWLLSGVGVLNIDDFYLTAGIGVDDRDDASGRIRSSLEVEYLYTCTCDTCTCEDWLRPGVGFRVEHVGNSDRETAYIPYVVLSGPNEDYTFLSQIQYRFQEDNSVFFFDLSVIF